MNKKYELVPDETVGGLTRIRALRDIPKFNVKVGDLGGYIKSERNLSHDGDCWVSGYACVSECSHVSGDSRISGHAHVFGEAHVSGASRIKTERDYCVFSRVGSENGVLTVSKGEAELFAVRGCFTGTLDEFEAAVNRRSNEQIKKEYALLIQFARLRLGGAA